MLSKAPMTSEHKPPEYFMKRLRLLDEIMEIEAQAFERVKDEPELRWAFEWRRRKSSSESLFKLIEQCSASGMSTDEIREEAIGHLVRIACDDADSAECLADYSAQH